MAPFFAGGWFFAFAADKPEGAFGAVFTVFGLAFMGLAIFVVGAAWLGNFARPRRARDTRRSRFVQPARAGAERLRLLRPPARQSRHPLRVLRRRVSRHSHATLAARR